MPPKLLALDLDGTLVRRDGQVDERDARAIQALHARGVLVTIMTGRLYSGSRSVARQLDMSVPIGCIDGAVIVDPRTDEELQHLGIAGAPAALLREALSGHDLALFPFADEVVVHDDLGSPFVRYIRSWSPKMQHVALALDHECWSSERGLSALVAVGLDEPVKEVAAVLRPAASFAVMDFPVAQAPGGPIGVPLRALIVHAAGVSKGQALQRVAEHCRCPLDHAVAVGDWVNDVSMFAVAGRSFVMGHAPEPVKQAATDRLEATGKTGGGVAEVAALVWG